MSTENKERTPEFEAMVKANKWHGREELEKFLAAILSLSRKPIWTEEGDYAPDSNRWTWVRNMECKYVDLRVDMRDGGFVLRDRNGHRISLEEMMWQYTVEEDDNE